MDDMHLAAQLYTLRDHLRTPEEIERTLGRVREMGFRAVQVSGIGPISPERLQAIVSGLGLAICATHSSFERFFDDLPSLIVEHRLWNCRHIGLGAMPPAYRGSLEGARRFVREMAPIARRIASEGLRFTYHNHHFEFERFGGISPMDVLLGETDPGDFGILMDTYWVQVAGADPVKWIRLPRDGRGLVRHRAGHLPRRPVRQSRKQPGVPRALFQKGLIDPSRE